MKPALTICITGLLWLGANSATTACASDARLKPNVIFILADDLGWKDLGCHGSKFHESPNLDRLAAQGMLFTQAYSSSPYCSPSRAAIMTGRHPARLKITDYIPGNDRAGKFLPAEMKHELPLEEVTIAEVMKEHGYATWSVGKWHLGKDPFLPQNQGFDVNIAGNHSGAPASYFWPYGQGDMAAAKRYHASPVPDVYEGGKAGEHLCDRLTSEAIKLIESHQARPFFLYLAFYDVHMPLQSKPELIAKYRDKARRMGLPEMAVFKQEGTPSRGTPAGVTKGGDIARGQTLGSVRQDQNDPTYAAMVEVLDTNVGRLLSRLKELGLDENTIVVFTSDNGGHHITSNLPLRGCKGWLYEGGVRVPWIVKWPGVTKAGSICDAPVINTDFFPTTLEMAGLPSRPGLHKDGVSFASLLKGETKPVHDALFWHFPHYGNHGSGPASSIRVGDWKLIEWIEDNSVELFDLSSDLGEERDVASQHPGRVKQMRERLHAWRQETGANMPRRKPAVRTTNSF